MEIELKHLEPFLKKIKTIYQPSERTLLAFSGGVDSTVLFYLLLALKNQCPHFHFEALHLNHQLRHEAEQDEQFVRDLSCKYKVPFWSYQLDIKGVAQQNQWSLEEAGRKMRYDLLEKLRLKQNLDSISTAHQLEDQVEGFLMHLFKGAGLGGLSGMKARHSTLVRPLLEFSKNEIEDFARVNQLDFRQDQSNQDRNFLRNQVRHEIYPVIKEIFPQFEKKILQFQNLASETDRYLKSHLLEWEKLPGQLAMDSAKLKQLPLLLLREQLLTGLKALNADFYISTRNLNFSAEKILAWEGQAHLTLLDTKHFMIIATYKKVFMVQSSFFQELSIQSIKPGDLFQGYDKVLRNISSSLLQLLPVKPGMQVFFDAGHKKLKDYLVDQKVYYHWRKQVYVLSNQEDGFLGLWILPAGKIRLNKAGKKCIEVMSKGADSAF